MRSASAQQGSLHFGQEGEDPPRTRRSRRSCGSGGPRRYSCDDKDATRRLNPLRRGGLAFSFVRVVCCFRIRRRSAHGRRGDHLEEDFALASGAIVTRKSSLLPGGGPVGRKHRRGAVRRVPGADVVYRSSSTQPRARAGGSCRVHLKASAAVGAESDLRVRGEMYRLKLEGRGQAQGEVSISVTALAHQRRVDGVGQLPPQAVGGFVQRSCRSSRAPPRTRPASPGSCCSRSWPAFIAPRVEPRSGVSSRRPPRPTSSRKMADLLPQGVHGGGPAARPWSATSARTPRRSCCCRC